MLRIICVTFLCFAGIATCTSCEKQQQSGIPEERYVMQQAGGNDRLNEAVAARMRAIERGPRPSRK